MDPLVLLCHTCKYMYTIYGETVCSMVTVDLFNMARVCVLDVLIFFLTLIFFSSL